uniref:Bis(5'-nucleosyl)-tetraphosphatase [asymmetrical] n=1 Tax=Cacopsylla melanoneura TaxID=428564 RepID=A0A8D9FHF7_9HEMI
MAVLTMSSNQLINVAIVLMALLLGLSEAKPKRPKNMSVRAAGIILYRGSRPYEYLLMKANYPPYHWSPPKGHLDGNETDLQAAVREVEEESGYKPGDYAFNKNFKHEMEYKAHGRNKTVVYFMAELVNNIPPTLSKEHQDYKWVSLEEGCELFVHHQMEDLFHAADVHLAMNVPSKECKQSELDFSDIPIASEGKSKEEK